MDGTRQVGVCVCRSSIVLFGQVLLKKEGDKERENAEADGFQNSIFSIITIIIP